MMKMTLTKALDKAKLSASQVEYIFAGDLLNQCIGTSFGLRELNIPFFGLFGACSTMAESLALASMTIDGGFADTAAAITSSHFCGAERQFRFLLNTAASAHRRPSGPLPAPALSFLPPTAGADTSSR